MTHTMMVHHTADPNADTSVPDVHQDTFSKNYLGFWIYLMSDCLVFATLFVTYALYHQSTFGGPGSKELFNLPTAFAETILLLLSSLTCGLGMLCAVENQKRSAITWFCVTFILGISFITLELTEFMHLIQEGHSWKESAFLSSFFTLVGTHGLHVSFGLLWLIVMIGQLIVQGIVADTFRRLVIFSLFWHFLDVIWIFIFTLVYLMGVS